MIKPIFGDSSTMQLLPLITAILIAVCIVGLGLIIAVVVFVFRRYGQRPPASPPLPQPPLASPPVIDATVTLSKCPQCHLPLPPNAPEGLCPQCLAKVAMGSEPAAPSPRIAPDVALLAPLFPQLEIIELLGMGGMGMVYKARQPRLDRIVALKILPMDSAPHPSFAERFNREAKALAKLNHPGIVDVYDFGQTGQYYYFVMEYVDGMNLRELLNNEKVTPHQALELVVQICTALQYAHDEGVVHRDIKPENILLNKKGQVKIADFGLAKLLGNTPDTALTMSQAAMGTLNYMAPEQRQNAQSVDHRADIYSLGVVFYEMLTGEVPMGRFEVPSKKVHMDVRLDEVVLKALEREPARRYQHVSEVKSNLETITSSIPQAGPVAPGTPPFSSEPRLSRTAIVGAAFLILLIGVAVNFFVFNLSERPQGHWVTAQPPIANNNNKFVEASLTGWRVAVVVSAILAISSVLGMTICGWVAVTQIRRSSGRVYGLVLALFDGIFFPLLLADYLVAGVITYMVNAMMPNESFNVRNLAVMVIWSPVVLILDFFIVRKVWRICRRSIEL